VIVLESQPEKLAWPEGDMVKSTALVEAAATAAATVADATALDGAAVTLQLSAYRLRDPIRQGDKTHALATTIEPVLEGNALAEAETLSDVMKTTLDSAAVSEAEVLAGF
jgi:hypothetical protein